MPGVRGALGRGFSGVATGRGPRSATGRYTRPVFFIQGHGSGSRQGLHAFHQRILIWAFLVENGESPIATPGGDIDQGRLGIKFQCVHAKPDWLGSNNLAGSAVDGGEEATPAADENAIMFAIHIHAAGLATGRRQLPGFYNFQTLGIEFVKLANILHVQEDVAALVGG